MWAAKDNGRPINWHNGIQYCQNYSGGGLTDWRMLMCLMPLIKILVGVTGGIQAQRLVAGHCTINQDRLCLLERNRKKMVWVPGFKLSPILKLHP